MSSVSFARAELLKGLATGSIRLSFQPQIDLITQKIVGFEGVARWHHEQLGVLTPGLFLGLAAREGLLSDLSRSLVEDAAKAICSWRARGYNVDVSVNLSSTDMVDPSFGADILAAVRTQGALPHWIIFEASEEALAFAGEAGFAGLEALAGLGFKVALDAKGPPIIALDKRARALFCQLKCGGTTMLSVASQLHTVGASGFMRRLDAARAAGLPVVAVGAESQAGMALCAQLGFTRLQGKIISMPVSVERCTQFLERIGVHVPAAQPLQETLVPAEEVPAPQALDLLVLDAAILVPAADAQEHVAHLPIEIVDEQIASPALVSTERLTIFSLDFASNDETSIVEAA